MIARLFSIVSLALVVAQASAEPTNENSRELKLLKKSKTVEAAPDRYCRKQILDFEDFPSGTIVTKQYPGIRIFGKSKSTNKKVKGKNAAMVLDTDVSTGPNSQLITTGRWNVLLLSADGNRKIPTDTEDGGDIVFTFKSRVRMDTLVLFDVDKGATITLRDDQKREIRKVYTKGLGENSQEKVVLGKTKGVHSMVITLNGGGAVDDITYMLPCGLTQSPTKAPGFKMMKKKTQRPTPPPTDSPAPFPKPGPSPYSSLGPKPGPSPYSSLSPKPGPSPYSSLSPKPAPYNTPQPTPNPTPKPTYKPKKTKNPTARPTQFPTDYPTPFPTQFPTGFPTPRPTQFPTPRPTPRPTPEPTPRPTKRPTVPPTYAPLRTRELDCSDEVTERIVDGSSLQPALSGLANCLDVDLSSVSNSFVYSIDGESGMNIEFEGRCVEGPTMAVTFYSRPKNSQSLDDYVCEGSAFIDCDVPENLSLETLSDRDYLVVAIGVQDEDTDFTVRVVCQDPVALGCEEESWSNTVEFGKIPTFYNDLATCSNVKPDLPWRDGSEVYSVVGEKFMKIAFEAQCSTTDGNKNTLLVYSRFVKDGLDPTEKYVCEGAKQVKCNNANKKVGFNLNADPRKEYLFIAVAQGRGDFVSLEVTCQTPTQAPTQSPTARPTPNPTQFPTEKPTKYPTPKPTPKPSGYPTRKPTKKTKKPTTKPTKKPKEPTPYYTPSPTGRPIPPSEGPTPIKSSDLECGENEWQRIIDGHPVQDSFSSLGKCFKGIDLDTVETSFAYTVQGETGESIEFAGRCGTAVSIFSRGRDENEIGDYICEDTHTVPCGKNKGKNKNLSLKTTANRDYLVIVVGVPGSVNDEKSDFELSIDCGGVVEVGCGEQIWTNTQEIEQIPTFYSGLEKCADVKSDFFWRDASEAYSVVGAKGMSIDFGLECNTAVNNKNLLVVYSRDVKRGDGPTEGFWCEESAKLKCSKKFHKQKLSIAAVQGKEYLLIVASQGRGDAVTLDVTCPSGNKLGVINKGSSGKGNNAPKTLIQTGGGGGGSNGGGNSGGGNSGGGNNNNNNKKESSTLKQITKKHVKKQLGLVLDKRKQKFKNKAETTEEVKKLVTSGSHRRELGDRFSAIDKRRSS
eukprot:CAMPEP_0118684140 /NCGR_PEP_ID=MMETSP0800-20121206/6471_1 /TAXON_ID=210618 ORGANISM="Striatella unipunctata, Strain CCMP2910" /NCGR_SAMPLE_ID=MMETSP0800 /ASSEMBLY_ACC=CAM_ASM_000638 /LENGTH=1122 /DNA_ID=CAMNT_0006580799 /DNA_START=68 /DNA_END=3436 /DNA_ORIENTATION=+